VAFLKVLYLVVSKQYQQDILPFLPELSLKRVAIFQIGLPHFRFLFLRMSLFRNRLSLSG